MTNPKLPQIKLLAGLALVVWTSLVGIALVVVAILGVLGVFS